MGVDGTRDGCFNGRSKQQQIQIEQIIRNMNDFDINPQTPSTHSFQLSPEEFKQRFQYTKTIEDPYSRYYDICSDANLQGNRAAVRRYIADDEQKQKDVFQSILKNNQDMDSYKQLSEVEGMCRLLAYCLDEEGGQVQAAFEYNDISLAEIALNTLQEPRQQFYAFLLNDLLKVIGSARKLGIEVQDLVAQNLLIEKSATHQRLKLLYDQRQKQYDNIREGQEMVYNRIKSFVSPEKLAYYLEHGEELESINGEEAVFEIGLLLLDLIHQIEHRTRDDLFAKDQPLTRVRMSENYLIIKGDAPPELNNNLIESKIKNLKGLSNFMNQMIRLIKKMIASKQDRISLDDLMTQAEKLTTFKQAKIEVETQKERQIEQETPQKDVYMLDNTVKPSRHQAEKEKYEEVNNQGNMEATKVIRATMISETTLATKKTSQQTIPLEKNNQPEVISSSNLPSTFSKATLMSQVQCNSKLMSKFQAFIDKMLTLPNITTKQYFDKSIYHGVLQGANQKRNGQGIFVCISGDVYFGTWRQNTLVEGIYLFRNGEGFEGTVHRGKQGFGTYYYSNGNIYAGGWKNDVKTGKGRMDYPNGDSYEGDWSAGKKNGRGIYRYANGTLYEGNFVDGKKQGFGVVVFPNGTRVQANWQRTHVQGHGKIHYSNGNYFEGQYHRSEKHGEGRYIWDDAEYQGGFEKDALEGVAKVMFSSQEYYQGRIKNGKRCGNGKYRYSNGDEFQGEWKNDKKLYGIYKFNEGDRFQGRFKQNQVSFGLMVYSNGQSYEGEFSSGQREGVGTYRDVRGQILLEGRWHRDDFISKF